MLHPCHMAGAKEKVEEQTHSTSGSWISRKDYHLTTPFEPDAEGEDHSKQ